jgi:acylphosphatase
MNLGGWYNVARVLSDEESGMADDLPDATPENDADSQSQPRSQLDRVRLHAVVHGYVQGVGFRAHTQREAARQQITGWVMNRWDGAVEVVAEGPRAVLEQFEQVLQRGPRAAQVDRVETAYEGATGEFSRFGVRF